MPNNRVINWDNISKDYNFVLCNEISHLYLNKKPTVYSGRYCTPNGNFARVNWNLQERPTNNQDELISDIELFLCDQIDTVCDTREIAINLVAEYSINKKGK